MATTLTPDETRSSTETDSAPTTDPASDGATADADRWSAGDRSASATADAPRTFCPDSAAAMGHFDTTADAPE